MTKEKIINLSYKVLSFFLSRKDKIISISKHSVLLDLTVWRRKSQREKTGKPFPAAIK